MANKVLKSPSSGRFSDLMTKQSFLVGCLAVRVPSPEHKVFAAVGSICLAHLVSWASV